MTRNAGLGGLVYNLARDKVTGVVVGNVMISDSIVAADGPGDADSAVALLRGVVADRADISGVEHPATLVTKNNLAYWYGIYPLHRLVFAGIQKRDSMMAVRRQMLGRHLSHDPIVRPHAIRLIDRRNVHGAISHSTPASRRNHRMRSTTAVG